MNNRFSLGSVLLLLIGVSACGGAPAAPAAPSVPASSSATAPAPAAWAEELTIDQKVAFMKEHVTPGMSKVFREHDASRYASFGCATCHGPDKKDPKDFLPRLTMKDGKLTAFAEAPEVSKFMAEKVVPPMASFMGQKPYDPATGKGFGCGGCHGIDMK